MNFLAYYFIVTAVYLAIVWWDNARLCFRDFPTTDVKRKKWPLVSVCIPARNEETRIGPCLDGFLNQDYPNYEVIILDDQSTDGTWKLLQKYAKKTRRFKLMKGKPLPSGWMGKSWACHQLSFKAKGEWLLFTDADTWHQPDSLKRAVQAAENNSSDMVSCMTGQVTKTWMEYLIVPVMCYDLISFFPKRFILKQGSPFSQLVWANGQFIFFRRETYKAIGGHTAVKNRIDEDMTFGKVVIGKGYRLSLFNGSHITTCRMYTSAKDVWEGFSKIMFQSFNYSVPQALIGYLAVLAVTVLPFLIPFFTTPGSLLFNSAVALSVVQVVVRLEQSQRFGFPFFSAFLHPLANFIFIIIGFNSMRWYLIGKGYWKGRVMELRAAS